MDFNTQRRAVGAIDGFAKRHRLLRPVCAAIKVLVIAFCSFVRTIDMAFSDKNGNFLGIRHKSSDKRQKIARAEGRRVRREYHAVKRPFFLRCISAMLAVCFGFMVMPKGLAMPVFAAAPELVINSSGTIVGMNGSFDTYPGYITTEASDSFTKIAEGAFKGKTNLTSVDLRPNAVTTGITYIGDAAFSTSSLTAVHLYLNTGDITISGNAFAGLAPDSALYVDYSGGTSNMNDTLIKQINAGFGSTIGNTLILDDKGGQYSDNIPASLTAGSVKAYSSYNKVYIRIDDTSTNAYTGYAIYSKTDDTYKKIANFDLNKDTGRTDILKVDNTYYIAIDKSKLSGGNCEFAVRPYKEVTAGSGTYPLYSTEFTHADYPQNDTILKSTAAALDASLTVKAESENLDVTVEWNAAYGKTSGMKTGIQADFYVLYYYGEDGLLVRDAIVTNSDDVEKYTDTTYIFGGDGEEITDTVKIKVSAFFDPLERIDEATLSASDYLKKGQNHTAWENTLKNTEFFGKISTETEAHPEIAPPTNLKWRVSADDEITFSWEGVEDVDGYYVTFVTKGYENVTTASKDETAVSVKVDRVSDKIEIYVQSYIDFNENGKAESNELSKIITSGPLAKQTTIAADISKMRVKNFKTSTKTESQAVISWVDYIHPNGSTHADSYVIDVYEYGKETSAKLGSFTATGTSITLEDGNNYGDFSFKNSVEYEFVIRPVFNSAPNNTEFEASFNNFGNYVLSSKASVMARSEAKPPVADSVTLKPGDRQIGISWTAPTKEGVPVDIDGYIVEVYDHDGELVYRKSVSSKTTEVLVEKLDNGEAPHNGDEYKVKLYSYYDAMDSCSGYNQPPDSHQIISDPWVDEEGKLPSVVPIAKIILYASWQTSDKIEERGILLQWTKVNQSDSYQLWRKGWHKDESGNLVPDDDFKLLYDGSEMEYLDRSQFIYEGKTYTYYVIPFYHGTTNTEDIYKDLMKSDEVPYTVNVKPAAPANVKSIGADGEITLSWDRVEGANGYRVYVVGDEENPIFVEQSKNERISWVDDLLPNGVIKNYYVTSVVTIDPTDGSTIHIVAESDKAPVGSEEQESGAIFYPPMDLVAVGGENKVTLTWSEVDSAQGYVVCTVTYDETGNPIYKEIDRVADTSTVITGLENGEVYTYAVYAYKTVNNKVWESKMSNHVTAVVGVYVPIPLDLKAEPGNRQVQLTWTAVSNATGYELECYDYNTGEYEVIATTSKPGFLHQNLTNDVTYRYRVRAYREITTLTSKANKIYSDYSTVVSATPSAIYSDEDDPYFLETPKDFTVTASDGQASLSWTKVDNAEGYEVYIVNDYGVPVPLDQLSKTSLTHTGLTNGSVYTYTVRAYKTLPDGSYVYSDYAIYKTVVIGNYLAAPIDVVAIPGDKLVNLSWSPVVGAEGYVIYAYDAAQSSFTAVGVVSGNNFTHTGLLNGRTYTYMIAAYITTGGSKQYSQYSLAVSATPEEGLGDDNDKNNNNNNNSNNNNNNNNAESVENKIFIVGTTPNGLSHTELITAYTDKGALTSDFDLRFSVNDESTQAIYEMLNGYGDGLDSFDVFPFDLTLYISGTYTRVQPAEGHYITVTMPIPDSFAFYGEDIQLMHITVDGKMEILPLTFGESEGIPMVQFKCSSFSPFAFVHYYSPEDMESSAAGTAAAMTMGSSVYSMRCSGGSELYKKRRRNKIYKIVK